MDFTLTKGFMMELITPRPWWSPHNIKRMNPYYLLYFQQLYDFILNYWQFYVFFSFGIITQTPHPQNSTPFSSLMKCIKPYVTNFIRNLLSHRYNDTGKCKYDVISRLNVHLHVTQAHNSFLASFSGQFYLYIQSWAYPEKYIISLLHLFFLRAGFRRVIKSTSVHI